MLKKISVCLLLMCLQVCGKAETWPTLTEYVSECVLIVKAKARVEKDSGLSFQVTESWKGKFDPENFIEISPEGRFFGRKDEHGLIDVADGQDVIFFFTSQDTQNGKIGRHSTSFVVRKSKVIYAATDWSGQNSFVATTKNFKRKIQKLVKAEQERTKTINSLTYKQLSLLEEQITTRKEELVAKERARYGIPAPIATPAAVANIK